MEAQVIFGDWIPLGLMAAAVSERCKISAIVYGPCETPIEVILGAALLRLYPRLTLVDQSELRTSEGWAIAAQFEWKRFRIDWAIRSESGRIIFVECDGAAFHSSHEQLERDARKDRMAAKAGIPVLRFTGSEIVRNHDLCANQIMAEAWL